MFANNTNISNGYTYINKISIIVFPQMAKS